MAPAPACPAGRCAARGTALGARPDRGPLRLGAVARSRDRAGGRLAGADAADERGRAAAGGPRARVCRARCGRALLSRPSRRPERPRAQPRPGLRRELRRRRRADLLEIARFRDAHHRGRLRRLAGPGRGDPPAGVIQPRRLQPRGDAGVVHERSLRPRAGLHRATARRLLAAGRRLHGHDGALLHGRGRARRRRPLAARARALRWHAPLRRSARHGRRQQAPPLVAVAQWRERVTARAHRGRSVPGLDRPSPHR